MRRDAVENRHRILDHAEVLFATHGLEVGFHRIANDLGIGVGTVYRHFPDHGALYLGLYERYRHRIDEFGEEMLQSPQGMPRVLAFIDSTIAFSVRRPVARGVAARVRQLNPERVQPMRWEAEVAESVRIAQETGELRSDADVTDVAIAAGMVADLAAVQEPQRSLVMPRMRALILDALRPEGASRPSLDTQSLALADVTALAHQEGRA